MEGIALTVIEHLPYILMIVISLPIHELAHGMVANWLGDDTAYYQGRLTLNPLAHLDLFGTISMAVFGFGWAKPVPVNPRRFKCNMRLGMALTAFAGPLSNIVLALVFMVVSKVCFRLGMAMDNNFLFFVNWITFNMSIANVGLAFFNLLPIPPLDGSRILNYFLPLKAQMFFDRIEAYSFYILMGLLLLDNFIGVFSFTINLIGGAVIKLLDLMTFFLGAFAALPLEYFFNF